MTILKKILALLVATLLIFSIVLLLIYWPNWVRKEPPDCFPDVCLYYKDSGNVTDVLIYTLDDNESIFVAMDGRVLVRKSYDKKQYIALGE